MLNQFDPCGLFQPPPADACQSCCKSTSVDEFLYRINSPLLLTAKYCRFTYAISSAEGANFSLTIVVMVQKSNAIRANCLSTPAQFNYSCAAGNYCLAVWDARLMNDIRTCFHLALLHPCMSFHRHSVKITPDSFKATHGEICGVTAICPLKSATWSSKWDQEQQRFNLMIHPEGFYYQLLLFFSVLHCKKEIKVFVNMFSCSHPSYKGGNKK